MCNIRLCTMIAAFVCNISMHQLSSFISRGNILQEHLRNIHVNRPSSLSRLITGHRRLHMSSKSESTNYGQNYIEDTSPKFTYQIKKAKKKDIKDISNLCVDTFFAGKDDVDDWFQVSREKVRVSRDLNNRWSMSLSMYT